MTKEDEIYADWLDLLGSDEIEDRNEEIAADLKVMHDRAVASHGEDAAFWSPVPLDYDRDDLVWVSLDGSAWCWEHRPQGLEGLQEVPAYDLEPRKTLVLCAQCGRRLA